MELFGAERSRHRRGVLEQANGGTVLVAEVSSLGPRGQERLLRVLKEGAFRRIGEQEEIAVDVRILCTASGGLLKRVERGDFREELFHRLSPTLEVPPLRERPDDVEPLARYFLAEAGRRLGKLHAFSPGTLEALRDCEFPGNVRELRFAVEQAAERSVDGALHPRDFEALARRSRISSGPSRRRSIAEDVTGERLLEVLRHTGGNRVRAAKALGISRASLYRLLATAAKPPAP